jgi:hypothetical protein
MRYRTMEELIQIIQPLNTRTAIFDLYHKLHSRFVGAAGSQHNHQAWEGGYIDHITETMNIGRLLYQVMNEKRRLNFSVSDVLIVLFLHDLEKAFPERIEQMMSSGLVSRSEAKDTIRHQLFTEHGIYHIINESQLAGLRNVEGEKNEYSNQCRGMTPLSAFCHMCDIASARLWFDRPFEDAPSEENPREGNQETWGWRESTAAGDRDLWGV